MVEKTGLSNIPNSHLPSASLVGQFEDTHKKESMAGYMEDNLDMPLGMLLPIMQDSIINRTTYFGVRTWKGPIDAWLYQEIIFETKPDVIVEIGNSYGGSALLLAHLCDLIGNGRVIGLDLSHQT